MTRPGGSTRPRSWGPLGALLVLAILTLAHPASTAAQSDAPLALGLTAAWVDMETLSTSESLSGVLYGLEVDGAYDRYRASAAYQHGWLGSGAPGVSGRRVTTLRGALGVRVRPWLTLEGGPSLSVVDLPDDDRHILRWRIGALGAAPLVTDLVDGYASASASVAGTGIRGVSVPMDGGAGEIGLLIEPLPALWARLGYRYEREYLDLGWSQTFQTAFLTVGVAIPRVRNEEHRR